MKQNLPTVTIAVSAYNEASNIKPFLQSVLSQKADGFVLEKILIISDGSTDGTDLIAKSLGSAKIDVRRYKERIGKSLRLNEIYTDLTSDILVQSDADVIFSHPFVIRDIIKPLVRGKFVGMCGGHPQPVPGNTFVENAINCTAHVYAKLRRSFRDGNNCLSVDGRLLAYKKNLIKQIHIPEDMIANDVYTFFCCLTLGYRYRYVSSAIVLFRSPKTVKDQIRQNTRFRAAPMRMMRYFPKNLVYDEMHIPLSVLLPAVLDEFIRHPVYCSYIFIINLYTKVKAKYTENNMTAAWPMAKTTKVFNN